MSDSIRAVAPPGDQRSTVSKWIPTTNLMMLRRMGKLAEELGELNAVAARCIIQGIDEIDPGSNVPNRVRLTDEIADVYAQLDVTVRALGLDWQIITARRERKTGYMHQWEAMFAAEHETALQTHGATAQTTDAPTSKNRSEDAPPSEPTA